MTALGQQVPDLFQTYSVTSEFVGFCRSQFADGEIRAGLMFFSFFSWRPWLLPSFGGLPGAPFFSASALASGLFFRLLLLPLSAGFSSGFFNGGPRRYAT